MKLRLIGLAVIIATLVLDQLSKAWVLAAFEGTPTGQHTPILPFFDLVLWWNRGVSFGMLVHAHDAMPYILTGLALIIAAALGVWLYRTGKMMEAVALGLIIGGAVGNVIDRLRFGAVVDFIYLHYQDWYWPAFNVADSAICVGVVLMLIFGTDLKRTKSAELPK